MASRLFHAVVGVGISLGSVSACGGVTSDSEGALELPDANGPEASPEATTADAGPADAAPASDALADAPPEAVPLVDATPVDAAPDVPMDAIVAAFCDVTWPITKAGREVCGPADECAGQAVPFCYGPDGQGSCKLYPLQCVGAEWQCTGGVTPTATWGPPPTCQ
jgi:hypothetical protein